MDSSGHFYSHMDPVWSLLIVRTGFVPWVELPLQRRLCPIFVSRVELPNQHPRVFRRLTSCQLTPGIWDVTVLVYDKSPHYMGVCTWY